MPSYESVFIARQDVSALQADALADQFIKIIEDGGGGVPKREYWGLRTIAYRIKKNRKGHYILLNIDSPAEAVHEMERQMRLNEDVIRTLTIRVDELEEGPSVMMRSKGRDDRPRSRSDQPRNEAPKDDRPRNETPKDDQPRNEASKNDSESITGDEA